MIAVVTYDIVSNNRRARLHRFLKEFGLNTQKSVFECQLERDTMARLVAGAKQCLDPYEDSFRIYRLCRNCQNKVAISGLGIKVTTLDYLVV